MGFKTNLSEATQGGLKPEGDYECIITAIEERTTRSGATGLNVTLVIRNDVQGQKYGNACLFYTLWKRREPTELDMQVNGYGFGQIMALGKAAGLPDGKDYESLKQYCEELINKCVRVTLKHESDPNYKNGEPQERVSYLNPTKHSDCKHKFKTAQPKNDFAAKPQNGFASNAGTGALADFEEVIDDDGVPF